MNYKQCLIKRVPSAIPTRTDLQGIIGQPNLSPDDIRAKVNSVQNSDSKPVTIVCRRNLLLLELEARVPENLRSTFLGRSSPKSTKTGYICKRSADSWVGASICKNVTK